MKTYSIDKLQGGLIASPKKTYAFTCVTFMNGRKTKAKVAEGAKLIYVLDGEVDIEIEGKPFRLKKNYWINIPKGKEYSANVYRTIVDCKFIILTCLRGAIEDKIMFGDLGELPLVDGDIRYALFGQESEVMQAHHLEFTNKEAVWEDKSLNEGFIYARRGELKVRFLLKEVSIPEGSVMFIPANRKFAIHSDVKADAILVTSPTSLNKVVEYTDWLKDKYGYLWNDGGIKI